MAKTVAKKENSSEISVPDYLAQYSGEGTENVSDLTIVPRIKLLQGLNPEVVDDGQRAGDFYHTVAETSMGSALQIVPVYVSQSVILWRPRKDGGGILARADDGIHWDRPSQEFEVKLDTGQKVIWNTGATVQQGGLTNFGTMDPNDKNSYPAATRMINIIAMFPEHVDLSPAAISLQRSSFKVGQQFVSKLAISKLPSWSRVFDLTSRKDRNSNNDSYFNWHFQASNDTSGTIPKARIISEEDVSTYRGMYEHFSQKGFGLSGEDEQDDAVSETDDQPNF
tara:strand:- start:9545 stop:10387 length:843 start_codon:yes stop_codon:yes gene_type:complete